MTDRPDRLKRFDGVPDELEGEDGTVFGDEVGSIISYSGTGALCRICNSIPSAHVDVLRLLTLLSSLAVVTDNDIPPRRCRSADL